MRDVLVNIAFENFDVLFECVHQDRVQVLVSLGKPDQLGEANIRSTTDESSGVRYIDARNKRINPTLRENVRLFSREAPLDLPAAPRCTPGAGSKELLVG